VLLKQVHFGNNFSRYVGLGVVERVDDGSLGTVSESAVEVVGSDVVDVGLFIAQLGLGDEVVSFGFSRRLPFGSRPHRSVSG
jgi:hypothetical protein